MSFYPGFQKMLVYASVEIEVTGHVKVVDVGRNDKLPLGRGLFLFCLYCLAEGI